MSHVENLYTRLTPTDKKLLAAEMSAVIGKLHTISNVLLEHDQNLFAFELRKDIGYTIDGLTDLESITEE